MRQNQHCGQQGCSNPKCTYKVRAGVSSRIITGKLNEWCSVNGRTFSFLSLFAVCSCYLSMKIILPCPPKPNVELRINAHFSQLFKLHNNSVALLLSSLFTQLPFPVISQSILQVLVSLAISHLKYSNLTASLSPPSVSEWLLYMATPHPLQC